MKWLLGIACVVGIVFSIIPLTNGNVTEGLLIAGISTLVLIVVSTRGYLSFSKWHERWGKDRE